MSSRETQPIRMRPRPGAATELRLLARRVHFLAGIVVTPFVLVLCVTGLIYVFSPQIHDDLYHRQLYANAPISAPRPVAEQVQAALTAHPEAAVREVIPPPEPGRTTRVVLSVPDLTKPDEGRSVFVDPYTNFINGELTTVGHRMPANIWLRELHSNLRLGEPGRVYAEMAATWLPVVVLGGLVVWLAQPRRRGKPTWRELLVPGANQGPKEPWWRMRALHGPLGVWLTAGTLALSFSGLAISEYAGGRDHQISDPARFRSPQLVATPPYARDPSAPPPESANPLPPELALPPPTAVPAPQPPETFEPVSPGPANPGAGAGVEPEPQPEPEPEPEPSPEPPDPPRPSPAPEPAPSPPAESYPPVSDPPTSVGLPPLPLPQLPLPDVTDLIPDLSDLLPDTQNSATPASTAPASTVPAAASQESVTPIGVDEAIEIARAQGLRGEIVVTPPEGAAGAYTVVENSAGLPLQRDSVAIDAATGEVTERLGWDDYSVGAKFTTIAAEFHTGTLFGLVNQVVLAVLAIGLIVLIAFGLRMWWVHNPYRGRWASLPPPVWKQLSGRSLALVIAAVAVLTWALPMLGIGLVLFVLCDAAINAIRRRQKTSAQRGGR